MKSIKVKSELIALLILEHNKQSKLLNPKATDSRFLYLLDIIKKMKLDKKIIAKIQ